MAKILIELGKQEDAFKMQEIAHKLKNVVPKAKIICLQEEGDF